MLAPLSPTQFLSQLLVQEVTFNLASRQQIDETDAGELLTADIGPRLWTGTIKLGELLGDEIDEQQVLIDSLLESGRFFAAYHRRRPWPRPDPQGVLLLATGATPVIAALPEGARSLQISGLPAGYTLTRGDMLSWSHGGYQDLHRVVDVVVAADTAGVTPPFEVQPAIDAGVMIGAAVTLGYAWAPALIVPGSVTVGRSRPGLGPGGGFSWLQTRAAVLT